MKLFKAVEQRFFNKVFTGACCGFRPL